MTERPSLSVVVGLIAGDKEGLRRCLRALSEQTIRVPMELIIPYDDPCADVVELGRDFPGVRFLRAEGLDTWRARRGASREHHDTLRTIGIRAAGGDIIALTEDHAFVAPTWCEEMVAALDRVPRAGAVGGAVECEGSRVLNWAVWFCDFGRYQNPLPEGPSEFVSDSNVAYRRSALYAVEEVWRADYHETAVHWAMAQAGFELHATPRVVVWQARTGLTWAAALKERFVWARSFAGTRARMAGSPKRWIFAALSPALPLIMTWRIFKTGMQRGGHTGRLIGCLPAIALLQVFWALGELVGYLTADPG